MSVHTERRRSRELSPAEFLADIEVAVTDRMSDPIDSASNRCHSIQQLRNDDDEDASARFE